MLYISDYELRNHFYLGTRNTGPTYKMKGNIGVINIFVNDSISCWYNEGQKQSCLNLISDSLRFLENEASRDCCRVNLQSYSVSVSIPTSVTQFNTDWIYYISSQFGQTSFAGVQSFIERKYGLDDAPIMLLMNSNQRSFAMEANAHVTAQDEVSVIYQNGNMFDWRAYVHELLHQFGAADYYIPRITAQAAMRYFPDSIMFQSGNEIDDLTRYLIGWTDTLTDRARAFLAETKSVNFEMFRQAQAENLTGGGSPFGSWPVGGGRGWPFGGGNGGWPFGGGGGWPFG